MTSYRVNVSKPGAARATAVLPATLRVTAGTAAYRVGVSSPPTVQVVAAATGPPGPPGPPGPAGPEGPPGAAVEVSPGSPGDYATWGQQGVLDSAPMSTMMVSINTIGKVSLDSLTDAGSYMMPLGMLPDDAPAGADPDQHYVLAVTSSPATTVMTGPDAPTMIQPLIVDPQPDVIQAGIQILTQLTDPTKVWRRGFDGDPPTFGEWTLSGAQVLTWGTYRHVQANADTVWTIPHNLGFRPNVAVQDSAGETVVPGAVDCPDSNTMVLSFSAALAGEAFLS